MSAANPPRVKERYTSDDLEQVGFHDCRVSGVRWDAGGFEVAFDLDYIVEWVQPTDSQRGYRFWISPAELRFSDVDDLRIELAWIGLTLDCSIQDLHRREKRATPNGKTQWRWELELAAPQGAIVFWATDFELKIQGPPTLSATQELCRRDRG